MARTCTPAPGGTPGDIEAEATAAARLIAMCADLRRAVQVSAGALDLARSIGEGPAVARGVKDVSAAVGEVVGLIIAAEVTTPAGLAAIADAALALADRDPAGAVLASGPADALAWRAVWECAVDDRSPAIRFPGQDKGMARTPAPRPAAVPALGIAPLPSVHDLVRHAAIALNRTDASGDMTSLGVEQYDALALVALCIPAETIQDATAHLVLAYQAASELEDSLGDKAFVEGRVKQLRRALLSALPLVASAAGADLVQLGAENLTHRRAEVFGLAPE